MIFDNIFNVIHLYTTMVAINEGSYFNYFFDRISRYFLKGIFFNHKTMECKWNIDFTEEHYISNVYYHFVCSFSNFLKLMECEQL